MLHFGVLEIETPLFLAIVTVLMMLLQLLLCFKAKRKMIKTLPIITFAAITAICLSLAPFFDGWDFVGIVFIAICAAVVVLACAAVLAIFAIIKKITKSIFHNSTTHSFSIGFNI